VVPGGPGAQPRHDLARRLSGDGGGGAVLKRRPSKPSHLILRRREAPSRRMATNVVLVPTLRDAVLRTAPQGEVIGFVLQGASTRVVDKMKHYCYSNVVAPDFQGSALCIVHPIPSWPSDRGGWTAVHESETDQPVEGPAYLDTSHSGGNAGNGRKPQALLTAVPAFMGRGRAAAAVIPGRMLVHDKPDR
jgi:hypothetical protein